MTKREICERLMSIHNSVMFASNGSGDIGGSPCYGVGNAIRELILDIVAREEEREADAPETEMGDKAWYEICPWRRPGKNNIGLECSPLLCSQCVRNPKAEEKHPGVIVKPGKDGEIEFCWCQKCYAQAAVVHDPFHDGENWSYCQKCGASFRLKCREGEK